MNQAGLVLTMILHSAVEGMVTGGKIAQSLLHFPATGKGNSYELPRPEDYSSKELLPEKVYFVARPDLPHRN